MSSLAETYRPERLTKLASQLDDARSVQLALVPRSRRLLNLDVAVKCTPANEVGGDICDVFEGERGRTAIVIGDVSGKGLGASLLCGVLYGAVHSSSWTESAFHHAEATEALNDLFRRKTTPDRFASLFWGYYEPETSSFKYISAGHLPMLLVRTTNHQDVRVEVLAGGGPVLGIIEWGNYRQSSVHVEEGDLLVLFSDGIIEAINEAEEPFGQERLLQVIRENTCASPLEIQNAIHSAVRGHRGANELMYDDETMIIARFRNVPGESVGIDQFSAVSRSSSDCVTPV